MADLKKLVREAPFGFVGTVEHMGATTMVGLPADDSAARWDLSIVITAASLDAWHALSRAPAMVGAFDELAEKSAVVKAWTFEAV